MVYRYVRFVYVEGSTELAEALAIAYGAYFQKNGLLWTITVDSIATRADEAKADFEHVVRSFKFLD